MLLKRQVLLLYPIGGLQERRSTVEPT